MCNPSLFLAPARHRKAAGRCFVASLRGAADDRRKSGLGCCAFLLYVLSALALGSGCTEDRSARHPSRSTSVEAAASVQRDKTPVTARAQATTTPHVRHAVERGARGPTEAELTALAATLIVPVPGVAGAELVDTFTDPGGSRRHEALDIAAARGTPVLAAITGRLLKLFTSERGGLMVYAADETERFIFVYAHLERYAAGLTEGMAVRRGQILGYVGTTGNARADAPHLHFMIAYTDEVRM